MVERNFPVSAKRSICGLPMGWPGALICALEKSGRYQRYLRWAPITNSDVRCPGGKKARRYWVIIRADWKALGTPVSCWRCERAPAAAGKNQGEEMIFLGCCAQRRWRRQARSAGHPLTLRRAARL